MKTIRVLLVDDHVLFAESLKTVLQFGTEDMQVVGTAYNGQEALELVQSTAPDIILMDVRMPVMDGVQATRAIRQQYPNVRVIVLTTFDDDEYVYQALDLGASGYLLKDTSPDELFASIRAALEGAVLMAPSITARFVHGPNPPQQDGNSAPEPAHGRRPDWLFDLTWRERTILRLMLAGKDNKEIAQELQIAVQTVKNTATIIYDKLEVKNRVEAIMEASDVEFPD